MDVLTVIASSPLSICLVVLGTVSWLYLIVCVRALRGGIEALAAELRSTRDDLTAKTSLEQRGEILRRTGWIVSYLEEIDRKLSNELPDLKVASITAENLVVKPSIRSSSLSAATPRREEQPHARDQGTMRVQR